MSRMRRGAPMRAVLISLLVAVLGVPLIGYALYRSGTFQFNRPSRERYPITGVDVSHHQGDIDWAAVANGLTRFVFIKATEGGDFADRKFSDNWRGATAAGLPVGAYHFFTFCAPGATQARHFLRVAPPTAGALPPVADVEFVGNCSAWQDPEAVRNELHVFLDEVERAWKAKPILYVTADALDRIIADSFPGYPIWIRSVFREPSPDAHGGWQLWQFSDNSRIPGITGPVDRNALRPGVSLQQLLVRGS